MKLLKLQGLTFPRSSHFSSSFISGPNGTRTLLASDASWSHVMRIFSTPTVRLAPSSPPGAPGASLMTRPSVCVESPSRAATKKTAPKKTNATLCPMAPLVPPHFSHTPSRFPYPPTHSQHMAPRCPSRQRSSDGQTSSPTSRASVESIFPPAHRCTPRGASHPCSCSDEDAERQKPALSSICGA